MTAADHANTVRQGLPWLPEKDDGTQAYLNNKARHEALDALQTQAEDIQREWILESTHHAITGQLAKELEAAETELKEAYAKLERTNESFLAAEAERDLLAETIAGDMGWRAQVDQAEYSLNHCRGLLDVVEAERDRLEAEVTRWQDGYDVAAMRANRAEAERDRLADAARVINGDGTGEFNTRTSALLALRAALARTEQP